MGFTGILLEPRLSNPVCQPLIAFLHHVSAVLRGLLVAPVAVLPPELRDEICGRHVHLCDAIL